MVDIAHIIPTFERPAFAKRLINSIREFYPDATILVCDDSREETYYKNAVNIPANAYDIGLSAKRNQLVDSVEEPYTMVWDDDYVCYEDSHIEWFYELLTGVDGLGIVGGNWRYPEQEKRDSWFTGMVSAHGPIRKHIPPQDKPHKYKGLRYHLVDFTPNWFLARTDILKLIPWDEQLKLQEHIEHFCRIKAIAGFYSDKTNVWTERYQKRSEGVNTHVVGKNGKVNVYALSTFRNKQYIDGELARKGNWYKVDKDYAEELEQKGLVTMNPLTDIVRPFGIPPLPTDTANNLGVALLPDTTCLHMRFEGYENKYYMKHRTRDFHKLKDQKTGTVDVEYRQWGSYPYGEPQWSKPSQELLQLPE